MLMLLPPAQEINVSTDPAQMVPLLLTQLPWVASPAVL